MFYNLKNANGFKDENGIKFIRKSLINKGSLSRGNFTWTLGLNHPRVAAIIGDSTDGTFMVSTYILAITDYDTLELSFIIFSSATNYSTYSYSSFAAVLVETKKDSSFQYGSVATVIFGSRTLCSLQRFTTKMNSVPSIKLTAHVTSVKLQLIVNVWLSNVTDIGFVACY